MLTKLRKNSLFKDTGIYTLTSIINSAIPFLLLPILTRYLTPEDYGIVAMFALLTSIATPFIGITINGAIARQYYKADEIDLRSYVFNGFLILLINATIVGTIFFIFAEQISKITSFPTRSLWMVIIYVVSQISVSILLTLWQVQKKALIYGLFNNLTTVTNLTLSLIFVVYLGFGWEGRIYGQIGSLILFAAISVIVLIKKKWINLIFNKQYIKHALFFGLPLIPHALSGSIISMTDRFFITNMVGVAATGVYTVGYQVGSIINILSSSFNHAYVPWLYERLKRNEFLTKIKIVRFTYIYFIVIVLSALILGISAPYFLSKFLGKQFEGSSVYVIWIALGYSFNGMYLMVVNYIFYSEKTKILAYITFGTAVINIVLNYFFIINYGAIGAAQATTIVFAIKFIMVWIFSSRVLPMPWNLRRTEKNYKTTEEK